MAERELLDITSLQRTIRLGDLYTRKGKISKIMGLMVEATGLECNMGDICRIQLSEERYALAEVVGILEDTVQLMPYQELDGIGSRQRGDQHRTEAGSGNYPQDAGPCGGCPGQSH